MPLDNLTELKRRVPGGKYNLARAVAERARQLQSGQSTPLVEVKTPNPLSVAIDEIVQGKISFTTTEYVEGAPEPEAAADQSLEESLLTVAGEVGDVPAPTENLDADVNAIFGEPEAKPKRRKKAAE